MKILFVNGHLNSGGVEKSLIDILHHIDYINNEIDLLLLEEKGDYEQQIPEKVHISLKSLKNAYGSFFESILNCIKQKDWLCLKMRIIFLLRKLFGIKCLILAKKILTDNKHYDCVIGFRPGICTQIASFSVQADKCFTWWHHGEFILDQVSYLQEISKCDKIVSVSNACRNLLIEKIPSEATKIITIPNMVDGLLIQKKAHDFFPYTKKNILHIASVGRLSKEKHFENTIIAASCLKNQGFVFQWHLLGEGDLHDEYLALISKLNVSDCFVLEGNQINPYPYILHSSLFVHPSYVESQGLVVLEAMTLGVPCVVTKSLGPCEFIRDGVNGILAEQNVDSLIDKIKYMLTNKEVYLKIKENTKCPDMFLPSIIMKKINNLLKIN